MTPKQKYIGKYLERRMKNHNLPYGVQYLSLLAYMVMEAETAWKKYRKKSNTK